MKTNAATGAIETDGTKATDFEKYCTAKLEPTGTALGTPLVMTGSGTTKILGNIATVNIELKRRVSRFDIDNESAKTGLIIESVALGNGRNQATVMPGTLTTLDDAGRTASLIKYPVTEGSYLMLPKANQGVTESALYTYPLKDTDEAFLIIKGKYQNPMQKDPSARGIPSRHTACSRYWRSDCIHRRSSQHPLHPAHQGSDGSHHHRLL
ncbi:MAG: hypothetical protein ACLUE2_20920 [Bacteroides cellulosilyticus]